MDSCVDLRHFGLDKFRIGISFSMELGQDSLGVVEPVFSDEPTRAFREEAFEQC